MYTLPAHYGSALPMTDPKALMQQAAQAAAGLVVSGAAAGADALRAQGIDPTKVAKDAADAAGIKWRIQDQPWFWPAVIGGGVLVLVLLMPRGRQAKEDAK